MNLQENTKAWKEFEEWYIGNYSDLFFSLQTSLLASEAYFDYFSGIYKKFLDERGIYVFTDMYEDGWEYNIRVGFSHAGQQIKMDSRTEAEQSAIKKGFEIYNETLNKEG